VNFLNGIDRNYLKTAPSYVRAVRAGS
jgi:hypothetical protein